MNPRYLIGSGYFETEDRGQAWFHRLWWQNNIAPLYLSNAPRHVFVVKSGNSTLPTCALGEWINLEGNLGACGTMMQGNPKGLFMPGCPAAWMVCAWLAYANECDFIYVEQDMLVFGPWLQMLYYELGDKGAVFGGDRIEGCSGTSLFLIRHSFIPQWCRDYLEEGPEDVPERLAEAKWKSIARKRPEAYARFRFGYDKDRPFNPNDWVWYGQKFTSEELLELEMRGLISCAGMPENKFKFSNL